MKKILLKLMTAILAVAMITGTVASCALFEIDTDRDLERAVAVVNIDKGLSKKYGISGEGENIYKRELIAGYMSYGYIYVQSYGYSVSDTYSIILDNLINNKIIMQYARGELAKNNYELESQNDVIDAIIEQYGENMLAVLASDSMIQAYNEKWTKGKKDAEIVYGSKEYLADLAKEVKALKGKKVTVNDPLFRFLDYDAVLTSVASTIDSVNSLIESFMEDDHAHEHEDIAYSVRTTPTMDEDEDEELTESERAKLEAKAIKLDSKDRKVALAKAYDRFVEIGLVDSHEQYEVTDSVSILNLTYFRSALVGTLESEVITKFEDLLRDQNSLNAEEDAEQLWNSYLKLAETQKDQYENNSASLESALSAISDSTFVTYNPGTGYGYVSHILINFDAETKAKIEDEVAAYVEAHGAITEDQIQAITDSYVDEIVARDLRASWVQSGYGVLEGDQTIRFTKDYVYNTDSDLAVYHGTYERVSAHEEEDEDGNTLLSFNYFGVKPTDISFADFNTIVNNVIGKTVTFNTVDAVEYSEELKNRFEDLKFAFSSDEGNFNKYLGYLYSPETSDEQYVSAFAKAAAEVCDVENGGGAGAYKMFVSYEYGLHIVLCTKMVNELIYTLDAEGKAQFIADLLAEGTVAYNFLEATNALLENSVISKLANTYIQQGLSVEGVVVKNEKVYKDLIEVEDK